MGSFDASFKGSIFHKNFKQVIATDRHLMKIMGARMGWVDGGVEAGTVVARKTSTGFYVPYVDGQSDGIGTAVGVVLEEVDFGAATGDGASGQGTTTARVCIGGGTLYTDALVGMDAAGLVDLKARVVIDASGTSLTMF